LIPAGEQSGLQTRIATTESVLLCVRMKSRLRLWNWKPRFEQSVHKIKLVMVHPRTKKAASDVPDAAVANANAAA
jgi:hypothetical protein